MKQIKCKSGLTGWQDKLQKTYNNSFDEFKGFCQMYNIHKRLGFKSMKTAWETNPTICGSTEPSDCSIVYFHAVLNRNGKLRIKESFEPFMFNVENSEFCSLDKEDTKMFIEKIVIRLC